MISPKDVRYIASLARISLREEEVGKFTQHLESILGYVKKLNDLDVSSVEATSHVVSLKNVYRPDVIKESLSQNEATSIAVEKHNGAFKVPKVIE